MVKKKKNESKKVGQKITAMIQARDRAGLDHV